MNTPVSGRDFGKLESDVASLTKNMIEVREDLKSIKESWSEARGGMRVFIGLSAVLGSGVTYLITWIVNHLKIA